MGGFSTIGGGAGDLNAHRTAIPIDHPDGSITTAKLANLAYLTLAGSTSDPALAPGRIWFRSDRGELRWTPDGTNVYVIDPSLVVAKTWSDTTGHYFNTNPSSQSWAALPAIQLNNPATGHKRSFEDAQTGYEYIHGWYLKRNTRPSNKLIINAYVGAYHGYNATRANFNFVIADPATLDVKARNDSVPWLYLNASMSAMGWSNGSYGKLFSGYIVFTNPPSYSFSPANPSVYYNLVTSIPGHNCHILYGYKDSWSADWDQWASASNSSYIRYAPATQPPTPDVAEEFTIGEWKGYIARWDGEWRLWLKKGEKGKIVPLGRDVIVLSKDLDVSIAEPRNRYDKIRGGEESKVVRKGRAHIFTIKTDRLDFHKQTDTWLLIVRLLDGDMEPEVILGDKAWDGDKYGFYHF